MNVGKLRDIYNNLDIDYDRIQLYYNNCTELQDWYHKQLINIYIENEYLPMISQEEDCHGQQILNYYTDESVDKIDIFNNKLNKILYDKYNNTYNSSRLIN